MAKKADREWTWQQARRIRGKNPNLYRRDETGKEIYKPAYGTAGDKGWEVDHRNPKARGGTDHRRNLRALNTNANRRKGKKSR